MTRGRSGGNLWKEQVLQSVCQFILIGGFSLVGQEKVNDSTAKIRILCDIAPTIATKMIYTMHKPLGIAVFLVISNKYPNYSCKTEYMVPVSSCISPISRLFKAFSIPDLRSSDMSFLPRIYTLITAGVKMDFCAWITSHCPPLGKEPCPKISQ